MIYGLYQEVISEKEETPLDTLIREIREEANVEVSNIKYLGAVEVIEGKNIYYQLRFTAKASKINSFKKEFETIERKFVKLKDLNKYITWSEGITFKNQIKSAINIVLK